MDATLQYVVSGAPEGKVSVVVAVKAGEVTSVEAGKVADPDITVSLAYDEALAIASGETTPDASYMRGTTKVEGDHAAWLLELRDLRAPVARSLADLLD